MRFAVALMLGVVALGAQTFETVSIRPFVSQEEGDAAAPRAPGAMVYNNVSLKLLVGAAYGVRPDHVEGPGLLESDRFDIIAKPPAGANKGDVPAMLQHLLSDRFHAVIRMEDRDRTGYALVVGPDGLKAKRTKAITGVDFSVAKDHIDINGASLPAFAGQLASFMGRPVTDETHVEGSYDFRLNLTMAELKAASPSIEGAIAELGLRLETRTTKSRFVIVEKAEKPNPDQ
jgi:uncharacterized protein (TIGR03435 family)